MMSPDKHNHGRAKPTSPNTKDETLMNSNNNNTAKQPSSSSSPSIQDHHHQPQHLNCPRCDSPNTKFCYYNNYSLTQPRHFCKTCRRYWTKGGALRNVPVGGGCRKTKKIKRSSSSPSSILFSGAARGGDSFQGFLSPAAIDYQLGGSDSVSSLSARSLYNSTSNHFLSFGEMTHHNNSALNNNPSCFTITNDNSSGNPHLLDGSLSMGFDNYPKPQPQGGAHHQHNNHGGVHVRGGSSLTSSIESLSSINLNLHLKLQQQRMALLLGVGVGGGGDQNQQHDQHEAAAHHHVATSTSFDDIIIEKRPQSILFQDLEISRVESNTEFGDHHVSRNGAAGSTTEWFFDSNNPYSQAAHQLRVTTADPNVNDDSQNWSSGIQAWSDLPQYNALH